MFNFKFEERLYGPIEIQRKFGIKTKTWESASCKNLGIDTIIEKRLLDYYNNNGQEMQLLLDKNSLRFNKYMFKNYIIAKSERDATKIRLNQQSEVNMD